MADDDLVTLTNGVMLRGKPIPRAAVRRAFADHPEPPVPESWVESKQRSEPNPSDPAYLDALTRCHEARLQASNRIMYALGTEIVSVPDGIERPEHEGWLADLASLGVKAEDIERPIARYYAWLTMYAMLPADEPEVYAMVLRAYGLLEQEVVDAVEYFRSLARRRAASLVSADQPDHDRTDDNAPDSGDGTGVRRTGGGDPGGDTVASVGADAA